MSSLVLCELHEHLDSNFSLIHQLLRQAAKQDYSLQSAFFRGAHLPR